MDGREDVGKGEEWTGARTFLLCSSVLNARFLKMTQANPSGTYINWPEVAYPQKKNYSLKQDTLKQE